MKKVYSKPATFSVAMTSEAILATSTTKNSSGGSYNNALGKKPGASSWSVSSEGNWGE